MAPATITLHLPAYRARALLLASEPREAEAAYDANVGGYLRYLAKEAQATGYAFKTDDSDYGPAYSIDAADHAAKTAAHDWLDTLPDIWNWMP